MLNEHLKIGFVCTVPFHYHVYKNVYKQFENAFFVLAPTPVSYGNASPEKVLIETRKFFIEKQVNFVLYEEGVDNFFDKFDVLVSLYWLDNIDFVRTNARHVRMLYGLAKEKWNFAPWNACYDLILTYGTYSQEKLSHYTNSFVVGIPKYDHFFRDNFDKGDVLKEKIDLKKKTILYLPTWSNLSSIDKYVSGFEELAARFNVVIKLHHITALMEKKRIEKLGKNIILIDDKIDLGVLFKCADVVVSDYSGAIFEAMFFDKRIILLDIDESVLNDNKSHANIMMQDDSLEIKIRDFVAHVNDFESLEKELYVIFEKDLPKDQVALVPRLFEESFRGVAAVKAKEVILSVIVSDTMNDSNIGLRNYIKFWVGTHLEDQKIINELMEDKKKLELTVKKNQEIINSYSKKNKKLVNRIKS